jgi:hypothetical protein
MFGVLEKEIKNISPLYQREDLLNQLAFAVFSTSESFVFKQSKSTVVLIDKPNLVSNSAKFSSVINRTKEVNTLETSTTSNDPNTVQNKTDPIELNLLGLTLISLPSVLLEY